jgi:hypothetical protein|tara:strand:- start:501 stop:695 length:195 start_codon:yes stop_codon:yes gene_type:complete
MDDAQKIDRLIEIMLELKELARSLDDPRNDQDTIIATMLALIICVDIPDVTILPNNMNIGIALA